MHVLPKDLRERDESEPKSSSEHESSDVAVTVLHDLQQPVAVLRLLLELLPDASLRRSQVERLRDAALGEISAMQLLLSAGLEARARGPARVLGPGRAAERSPADSTPLDAIVHAVAAPFLAAGCRLDVVCDDDVVVAIPPLPLRRIVSNLVHNAVRAAGASSGQVAIELLRDRRTALLLIDDSGPGFGAIATEHGLGLLNSMAVVFSYGGSLQIVPSGLGGTGVRIALPVAGS